jgi:hypothetical protein
LFGHFVLRLLQPDRGRSQGRKGEWLMRQIGMLPILIDLSDNVSHGLSLLLRNSLQLLPEGVFKADAGPTDDFIMACLPVLDGAIIRSECGELMAMEMFVP